jgi:tetratricopeptide (TPR) repeat protein
MRVLRLLAPAVVTLVAVSPCLPSDAPAAGRRFEWSTKSKEAKSLLAELQQRIETFQLGPGNVELAKKIVAADPSFAMGEYYMSAVLPGDEALAHYDKARDLAKNASEGERRFIEAMVHTRVNQGADFKKSIEPLEGIAKDYPGERLVFVILGQLYNGAGMGDKAIQAFTRAEKIGPHSPRMASFLAADDLLKGRYAQARASYEGIEKELPKGTAPFPIRFGIAFSHLYEGHPDAAIESMRAYLAEYRAGGLDQQFPEVFIWNAIARVNLENGRYEEAMKAYEKGYESVPGSKLPEDQKKTWLGRLHHGKCRVLARMGKQEEAWKEAEVVRQMIEDGGEPAKQFVPSYHYLAGYLKLEAGDNEKAVEHLKQTNLEDPFHRLLLARALERLGRKDEAKEAYRQVVESQWVGIERPLAYSEAKRKLETL